ncbi:MAG TPA: STAS/SEC14 domain-containing protein [Desulfosarcina sp.]|nr:STAS/SEC14 domain-containing protein [Desulfosarcina sp.]
MELTEFKAVGDILTLDIRAEIRKKRFDAICRDLDRAVDELGKVRLVVVLRHYPSFNSAEDLYDDLRFLKLYAEAVDKVAVLGDRFWKGTWVGIFGLFSGIRMAFFDMAQVDAAGRWIRGA